MRYVNRLLRKTHKVSYAQCGEDLIVNKILNDLSISKPSYLDIGTHHPTWLNNTYFFYKKGCKGVCVEPNPVLYKAIKKKRGRDVCLNIGIGPNEGITPFYVLSADTLSTFSQDEAERLQSFGKQFIEKVINIPMVTVNQIIEKYYQKSPNFISIDAEGMDLVILKTFDFSKYAPEVFCVETLTYTENKTEMKRTEIIDFMAAFDYFVFADTFINSIFVNREEWRNRPA